MHISRNVPCKDSGGKYVGDSDHKQGEGWESNQPLVFIGSVKKENPSEVKKIVECNNSQEHGCCNTMFINQPDKKLLNQM